ncbi:MAG: type I-E CRISPR-associated protein Cas5/CasD [Deltaproteobacteria bacterium]|nr:type I-E CRISPR-associated protein Cas5/CasD [Deltaproteobacteria bacterium]
MKEYLIFRLYGPMASWGDIAVGEVRPSYTHPSKSAILGLIAAALGISRDQESLHRQLAQGYGFAVRTDSIGTPISDYHTAQVPPSGTGRKRTIFATRRDEIVTLPREKLKTILSKRDYRMDALATVMIWERASPPYSLEKLAEALKYPGFVLYLGRKSCPLCLPMEAQVVAADTLLEALKKAKFADFVELCDLPDSGRPALYWEENANAGMQPQHTFERRDIPLSRKRWQFDVRREYHASYPEED